MIVITTPTGDIGGKLLTLLLDRGEDDLRVVVRDPARLPEAVRDRVDVVAGSHADADVVDRAFAGADAVFWIAPPDPVAPSLEEAYSGFTRAATTAFVSRGVGHVVGVSSLGRGTPVADRVGLVTASLAMDDLIGSTGVAYRALANGFFMENLLRQVDAIRQGTFTDALSADRRVPRVATRDIAAAAADLLLDRSWTGAGEVPVRGAEDLSSREMAAIMSEVIGVPVRYEPQTLDDLGAATRASGAGEAFAAGMVEMMRAGEQGLNDGVPRTRENASPTTFRQWCSDVLVPALATSREVMA